MNILLLLLLLHLIARRFCRRSVRNNSAEGFVACFRAIRPARTINIHSFVTAYYSINVLSVSQSMIRHVLHRRAIIHDSFCGDYGNVESVGYSLIGEISFRIARTSNYRIEDRGSRTRDRYSNQSSQHRPKLIGNSNLRFAIFDLRCSRSDTGDWREIEDIILLI